MYGDQLCSSDLYDKSQYASTVLAYALNTVLTYLILLRTTRELKVYSRVLLCTALVDYAFATVLLMVGPHVVIADGIFFFDLKGLLTVRSPATSFLLTGIFLFTFYFNAIFVTVPFVYRYALVCRNTLMNNKDFLLLLSSVILAGLTVPISCYACYYGYLPTLTSAPELAKHIFGRSCSIRLPFFSLKLSWKTATPLMFAALTITYNYATVIWCSTQIWRRVRRSKRMSAATKDVHRQLNGMLIVQATLPLLLMAAPLTAMLVTVFSGAVDQTDVLMLITVSISWIPILNPLSTLYFVKCYRQSVTSLLVWKRNTEDASIEEPHTSDVFL